MIFKPNDTDQEEDDFFTSTPQTEEVPKAPKPPQLKPDDPRFYEQDDEWEHIRPAARNWKMWVWIVVAGLLIGGFWALYLRYFSPYESGAVQYGYVEKIVVRGDIFKTYEGVFLPYKSLADTIEPYEGDIIFSAADVHVAAELKRMMLANLPVRIEYSTYHAPLPWRGENLVVITAADTADVSKIYPPSLNHPLIPNQNFSNDKTSSR